MARTSKKPGGFKGLPRPSPKPDGPPGWAMTIAFDLIAKLEGYGDLSLIRDAERIAQAVETQYRLGFKKGQEAGAKGIVEFMGAVVEGQYK